MAVAQVKLKELETRVAWLERAIRDMRGDRQPVPVSDEKKEEQEKLSEREQLLAELKAEGLIRDPTPQEQASAERWRALPEEEKKAIIHEMQNLKPGPMLSDIIIQNRR